MKQEIKAGAKLKCKLFNFYSSHKSESELLRQSRKGISITNMIHINHNEITPISQEEQRFQGP